MNEENRKNIEEQPSSSPKTKSRRHILSKPKLVIPLAVVLLLSVVPLFHREAQVAQLPEIDEPFDLEQFLSHTVPDSENAYAEYRRAEKMFVSFSGEEEKKTQPENWNWETASYSTKKWLDENRQALDVWYLGTEKNEAQHLHPTDATSKSSISVTRSFRDFSHLAVLNSSKLLSEKKPAAAWKWLSASLRNSRHAGNVGFLVEREAGIEQYLLVTQFIVEWSNDREVNETLLRTALAETRTIFQKTVKLSEILKFEYVILEKRLVENDFKKQLESDASGFDKWKKRMTTWLRGEQELSHRLNKLVFQNWIDHIDRPPGERPSRYGKLSLFVDSTFSIVAGSELPIKVLDEIVGQTVLGGYFPDYSRVENGEIHEQAIQKCLEVALASQIYRRQFGEFTEYYDDLEPILGAYPSDPLYRDGDHKREIQYRKRDDGFIVWSVGIDGRDDNGNLQLGRRRGSLDLGFQIRKSNSKTGSKSRKLSSIDE